VTDLLALIFVAFNYEKSGKHMSKWVLVRVDKSDD